jgi:hypothetical protein
MRKTEDFMLFGFQYQMTQLSAVAAFERIVKEIPVIKLLPSVKIGGVALDGAAVIDELVFDKIHVMQPRFVLSSLLTIVNEFNFGFMERRKEVRVPSYLRTEVSIPRHTVESPILAALIAEDKATLRELEEYYSLEDAFRLYDIIFNEKLNEAESQYAASRNR